MTDIALVKVDGDTVLRTRGVTFHTSPGDLKEFIKTSLTDGDNYIVLTAVKVAPKFGGSMQTLNHRLCASFIARDAMRAIARMARNNPASVQTFYVMRCHGDSYVQMEVMVEVEPLAIADKDDVDMALGRAGR
jgi:hypothetical protein